MSTFLDEHYNNTSLLKFYDYPSKEGWKPISSFYSYPEASYGMTFGLHCGPHTHYIHVMESRHITGREIGSKFICLTRHHDPQGWAIYLLAYGDQ
jgi:hypothetical protein